MDARGGRASFPPLAWCGCECGCGWYGVDEVIDWAVRDALVFLLEELDEQEAREAAYRREVDAAQARADQELERRMR